MEFGKLQNIENIDWKIPPVRGSTKAFLADLPEKKELEIFLGTPAWGHKAWIGKIYPPKTKPADFLFYYAKSFNSVELNSSHYGIPGSATVTKWCESVPKDFLFCPKLLQQMSHDGNGLLDPALQKNWFFFLDELKDHRGPCFAQFPPHFDYTQKRYLFKFIEQWPKDFELALEFRHPSWFQNGQVLPALAEYLQNKSAHGKGVGLVITDVAGRRDVLHTTVTAGFMLLRFIGNNLHPSDQSRVQGWSERFRELQAAGLQRAFFFVHQPDDLLAPEAANTIVHTLNEELGTTLEPLKWCASLVQS